MTRAHRIDRQRALPKTGRVGLCFALTAVLVPSGVNAQSPGSPGQLAVAAEFYWPEDRDNRDIRLATLSIEVEKRLVDGLWLRGAGGPVFTEGSFVEDDGPGRGTFEADGIGLGVAGFLRWYPIRPRLLAPFVEAGFGMLFTTEEFPPSGTFWNFNQRYGLGLDVPISERFSLTGSYRHMHVSNGKGFGHPRNPSWDGDGVMLALAWLPG